MPVRTKSAGRLGKSSGKIVVFLLGVLFCLITFPPVYQRLHDPFEDSNQCQDNISISAREEDVGAIADCVLNGMTFFTKSKLLSRAKVLLSLSQVPGSIVEAGVALGGTAIFATKIAHGRPVHLYDVFGMIPRPDDEKDTHDAVQRYKEIKAGKARGFGNQTYYGYEQDLLSKVKANYDACQVPLDCVSFHRGLVEQTMKDINFRVAYLHCDTDFYSAVYHCLVDGAPHISLNGYIVIDDYFSYGSARNAVHDYFKINGSNYRSSRNQEFQAFKSNVLMLQRIA